MSGRCQECKWGSPNLSHAANDAAQEAHSLLCRVHPPTVQAMLVPAPGGMVGQSVVTMWPAVRPSDFCGRFTAPQVNVARI